MKGYKHFCHPHMLSFDKVSLEGREITCSGCKYACTKTPVYSCLECNFFLHKQCFDATRSFIHPLHAEHPLSLFPYPTYPSESYICNLCNKSGSGFCFCCSTCEFDLHVHCAYDKVQLKSHPNHPLHYLSEVPYASGKCWCDVCGTKCDPDSPLYHCDICGYDAHVECVNLPETVKREDHAHALSLLHVNPYESYQCDVCRGTIAKKNSLYLCKSGCDYGNHVKCVTAKVTKKSQ